MEDLLQDAFYTYVAKAHVIQDPEAWLTATLRNRCIVYIREAGIDRKYMAAYAQLNGKDEVEPHKQVESDIDLEMLEAQLSPKMRAVVRLTRTGYLPEDIAARLGYHPASVRKIRRRGEKAMREAYLRGFEADKPCSDPEPDEP